METFKWLIVVVLRAVVVGAVLRTVLVGGLTVRLARLGAGSVSVAVAPGPTPSVSSSSNPARRSVAMGSPRSP